MKLSARWSRRNFLRGTVTLVSAAALTPLAACAGGAPASPTTVPASKDTAPASKPTAASAGVAEAKPAATPSAAPAAGAPSKSDVSGTFQVWFSANWNTVTDEAIGQTFVEWGKQNGIEVEWQSIPGSPQQLAKESAAVAAGQPPEVVNSNRIYWYTQGEMADLTDLVNKYKDVAGGMYPIAIESNTAPDGKVFGAPYAIDVWPVQWREDTIKPATGGTFFKTWDELIQLGPQIQQPPRNYVFAFALGHEGDHVNNIVNVLWDHGGRIADEEGVPDIKNPANREGIEVIVRMWEAKLIPPDTFAQTVTSWNNETYQKGRAMIAINPCTIMGWLLVNDKELADNTGITSTPKGSVGSFAEGAAIGFNYFKKAKLAEKAPSALEFFLQPENVEKISKSVEGRFVPIYRDHTKTEFWQTSKFAEMKTIAENGRIREWPARSQAWVTDITNARYTLSDMMNKIINENMPIEQAQEWAQNEMMDSYNKVGKQS